LHAQGGAFVPTQTVVVPFTDAELAAWRGFLRTHAALVKELDADLEAQHQLPLSSYDVLTTLADRLDGRMRMRDLADAVVLSRSGLTRLVDRLQREGLIDREQCASDARGAYAVLTDTGRARLRDAQPLHRDGVRRRFLSRFSPDELAMLADCWGRLAEAP
jgi:DNA-binding MarR family transcriptional regulator